MSEKTEEIKTLALDLGADLVGVADLALLRGIYTYPPDLLRPFQRGISVAVRLADPVVDAITVQDPTAVYAQHYVVVNALLDQMTLRLTGHIQRLGYHAIPVHASQQLGVKRWYAAISHKAVARAAGLGWVGENLLLITPQYGPRVRLGTVLTDMPLLADAPQAKQCGRCHICLAACPANALLGVGPGDYPESREQALNTPACAQRLDFFRNEPNVGQSICGICMQVCPYGRKQRSDAEKGPGPATA